MRHALRHAVIVCLAIALGGCIQVAQRQGAERVEPQPGEVAFELAGPGEAALVVPVQVNGEGPFPFVLDTGATLTCVDQGLADELELPDAQGTVGIGGGVRGDLGAMRVVSIDSVSLGDASASGLLGCVVDLSAMQQAKLDVRGLLGLNFLKAYRVTIDFERRVVRLEPSQEASGAE